MKFLLEGRKACLVIVAVCTSLPVFAASDTHAPNELEAKVLEVLVQKSKENKLIEQLSGNNFKKKESTEKSEALEKREIYIAEGYVPTELKDVSSVRVQSEVDQLYRQSVELRKAGHEEQSIELLYDVLRIDASQQRARLILARELVVREQFSKVENLLLPLLHKSNTDWQPWFLAGTAQLMSGDLDLAAYSLDKALSEAGRFQAAVWVQRAIVEQQQNRSENALQLLRVAAELAPDDPQVYINMAYAYEDSGEADNANAYYQRFLESPLGTVKNNALRQKVAKHLATNRKIDSVTLQQ